MLRRRAPLAVVAALLLVGAAAGMHWRRARTTLPTEPRNLVIILADTLRADHLSLLGYQRKTSPHLDELARNATVFTNARSQASCTFPSVNSLLTSRDPMTFVMSGGRGATGRPGPPDPHGRSETYVLWQSADRPARFGIPEDIRSLPELLVARGFFTAAVSASPIVRSSRDPRAVNQWGGFGRGFRLFHEECLNQPASCVNAEAFRMLEHRGSEPFFLYLHYMDPHPPWGEPMAAPAVFSRPYSDKGFIAAGNPYPLMHLLRDDPLASLPITRSDLQHLIDLYDDRIHSFDTALRALFTELERHDLLRDTIIVLVADHGESFLEARRSFRERSIAHCQTVFESEIHVPLLFWIPGVRGSRSDVAGRNLDIVPTVLGYLGVDPAGMELEGESLRPAIERRRGIGKNRFVFSGQRGWRSATDGRFKLIFDMVDSEMKLFDLRADPREDDDVRVRHTDGFRRLRKQLLSHLRRTEGGVASARSLEAAEEAQRQLEALGYLR